MLSGVIGLHHIVVMGVSGVGKSAVGVRLAETLGYEFAEGDAFHPQANIDKMAVGQPLDDDDRRPWLEALAVWTRERASEGRSTTLACSALKRSYRDSLRRGAAHTYFVHLVGDRDLILSRIHDRNHFMPPELLGSQFNDLEPLEPDELGTTVDVTPPVDEIVRAVVEDLTSVRRRPDTTSFD